MQICQFHLSTSLFHEAMFALSLENGMQIKVKQQNNSVMFLLQKVYRTLISRRDYQFA